MVLLLYHRTKWLISIFMAKNSFFGKFVVWIILAFIFSNCTGVYSGYGLVEGERVKASLIVTHSHPAFINLEKKWVSSSYFDRGMNYQNSRLEVVSFSRLLDKYVAANSFDAILLNCFDDYQGIVTADDVRRYDLQLAIKIELAQESGRPTWLQPLLIVVPNSTSPPFLERFCLGLLQKLGGWFSRPIACSAIRSTVWAVIKVALCWKSLIFDWIKKNVDSKIPFWQRMAKIMRTSRIRSNSLPVMTSRPCQSFCQK